MANAINSARENIERALISNVTGSEFSGSYLLRVLAGSASDYIGDLGLATMLFCCSQGVVTDLYWTPSDSRSDHRLLQLSRIESLIESQGATRATCAWIKLLNRFLDVLVLMVGESATLLILNQALGSIFETKF